MLSMTEKVVDFFLCGAKNGQILPSNGYIEVKLYARKIARKKSCIRKGRIK